MPKLSSLFCVAFRASCVRFRLRVSLSRQRPFVCPPQKAAQCWVIDRTSEAGKCDLCRRFFFSLTSRDCLRRRANKPIRKWTSARPLRKWKMQHRCFGQKTVGSNGSSESFYLLLSCSRTSVGFLQFPPTAKNMYIRLTGPGGVSV